MAIDSPLRLLTTSTLCVRHLSSFSLFFLLSPLSFIQSVHSSSHLCYHYCRLRNFGLRLKRGKPVKSNTVQAKEATDASSSKSTPKPKSE
ncbi:hypothetical protein K438DRAFT_1887346 [Mycena galopus ATCC 62051]|nr:hypothetical protein K438DRAFT_1887346 [Mycena galopus ATCC 62051]